MRGVECRSWIRLISITNLNQTLTLYSINTHFDTSTTRLLKTLWEKKKLLVMSKFSFSHNVFSLTLSQTTNFRLFQTQKSLQTIILTDEIGRKFFKQVENTVGKGEILTSNFSFSHGVFNRLVLQTHENQGLFGKGLIR